MEAVLLMISLLLVLMDPAVKPKEYTLRFWLVLMVLLPVFWKNTCRIIPVVQFPSKTPVPLRVEPAPLKFNSPAILNPPEKLQ